MQRTVDGVMMHSGQRTEDVQEQAKSQNMMWIWGQFFMIPMAALVQGVELLLQTVQQARRVANQGLQVISGANKIPEEKSAAVPQMEVSTIDNTNMGKTPKTEEGKPLSDSYNDKYNYCNPDPNAGQCLKLWRFKVLFIKRDFEYAFREDEALVSDDISDITAWKIAEFIQSLHKREVEVPYKWLKDGYPGLEHLRLNESDRPPTEEEVREARNSRPPQPIYLISFPEDDKKYLRLFSQVLAEYTREEPDYDKEQVSVLRAIERNLRPHPAASPKGKGGGS